MEKLNDFTVINEQGKVITLHIVRKGDKHGRDDCLVHTDDQHLGSLVEWYDGDFMISSHYCDTIMDMDGTAGLCIMGHSPQYNLDVPALKMAQRYLMEWSYC